MIYLCFNQIADLKDCDIWLAQQTGEDSEFVKPVFATETLDSYQRIPRGHQIAGQAPNASFRLSSADGGLTESGNQYCHQLGVQKTHGALVAFLEHVSDEHKLIRLNAVSSPKPN